ncbi:MAG TPA: FAD-dependent oxidoreductase [Burkholderiales bacterium]|nr:FAD-dependent oxidoreductase [Burkholderiales bacterium]
MEAPGWRAAARRRPARGQKAPRAHRRRRQGARSPREGRMTKHVTVVGAGIVGIACAAYLRRDGHEVTVVDMRDPGEYCSFGNAGALSPGSCVPYALPGVLKRVPGWLADPHGPLSIRPRYLPKALPWLMRFVAASHPDRVGPIADALRALLRGTFEAYAPLVRDAGAEDLIRQSGYLFVYETEQGLRNDARSWKIRRDRGVVCEEIDAARIREMEPALRGIYTRGVWLPEQGYTVNPGRLTKMLAAQLVKDGGKLVRAQVLDIDVGPDGPRALVTDAGRLAVDVLVIAAGAHSHTLSAKVGDKVPLETQRGYHVSIENPTVQLNRPVSSGEGKFFVTPMETGLRVAGTVEFAGLDAPPDYSRADVLLEQAKRMFPELSGSKVTKWMGHRPQIPDTLPVISRGSKFTNVYHAFGHGHLGMTAAAPTGRLLAEMVGDRPPHFEPAPYRVDRF